MTHAGVIKKSEMLTASSVSGGKTPLVRELITTPIIRKKIKCQALLKLLQQTSQAQRN